MRVVEQAVKDGVRESLVGEMLVPGLGRQLAGHDRRVLAVAVFQNLEQVATLLIARWGEPPVVDDDDIDPGELGQQADVAAVCARQRQLIEEA